MIIITHGDLMKKKTVMVYVRSVKALTKICRRFCKIFHTKIEVVCLSCYVGHGGLVDICYI